MVGTLYTKTEQQKAAEAGARVITGPDGKQYYVADVLTIERLRHSEFIGDSNQQRHEYYNAVSHRTVSWVNRSKYQLLHNRTITYVKSGGGILGGYVRSKYTGESPIHIPSPYGFFNGSIFVTDSNFTISDKFESLTETKSFEFLLPVN